MTAQSQMQDAELKIRAALAGESPDEALLAAYLGWPEAQRPAFVAVLIGRVVVAEARRQVAR